MAGFDLSSRVATKLNLFNNNASTPTAIEFTDAASVYDGTYNKYLMSVVDPLFTSVYTSQNMRYNNYYTANAYDYTTYYSGQYSYRYPSVYTSLVNNNVTKSSNSFCRYYDVCNTSSAFKYIKITYSGCSRSVLSLSNITYSPKWSERYNMDVVF